MQKTLKLSLAAVGVTIVFWVGIKCWDANEDLNSIGNSRIEVTSLNFEDSSFIRQSFIGSIRAKSSIVTDGRNQIEVYDFEDGGEIILYQIDNSEAITIPRGIKVVNRKTEESTGIPYHIQRVTTGKMFFKGRAAETGPSLIFEMDGGTVDFITRSDSVNFFEGKIIKFGIRHREDGPADIIYTRDVSFPWTRDKTQFMLVKRRCVSS